MCAAHLNAVPMLSLVGVCSAPVITRLITLNSIKKRIMLCIVMLYVCQIQEGRPEEGVCRGYACVAASAVPAHDGHLVRPFRTFCLIATPHPQNILQQHAGQSACACDCVHMCVGVCACVCVCM